MFINHHLFSIIIILLLRNFYIFLSITVFINAIGSISYHLKNLSELYLNFKWQILFYKIYFFLYPLSRILSYFILVIYTIYEPYFFIFILGLSTILLIQNYFWLLETIKISKIKFEYFENVEKIK